MDTTPRLGNLIPSLAILASSLIPQFSLASATPTEEIQTPQILPFVGNYQVHRYQLENGLKILVVEDHASPTFAYQTWFNVGSKDEIPGKTGLAHLFEHMMFKGSKNYKEGEFDRILERAGVQGENAFTTRDFTVYIQELPKNKLDLLAKLEADRMQFLEINDKSFSTEKSVVENERKLRIESSPEGLIDEKLHEMAFKNHPYHWPIAGYESDLKSMTAKEGVKFYKTHYAPNRATIVVTGDVDPEEVYKTIKKHYGSILMSSPGSMGPDHKPALVREEKIRAPRIKKLPLNIQVEKLYMAYHVPEFTHDDIPALQVLQNVLTAGRSSRLSVALVDQGIATTADAYDLESKDPGLFTFVVNLQKGKKASVAEAILLRELEKLKRSLVSTDELERARNKLAFEFYDSLTSNFQKAMVLGSYETLTGDFQKGIKIREKMQTVTPQDIQRVAKIYFNPHQRVSVTGVPK